MPTGDFEKTNFGWQISQVQQQFWEWVELQLSRFESSVPEWSVPEWSIASWIFKLIEVLATLLAALIVIWLCWQLWRLLEPYVYSFKAASDSKRLTKRENDLSVAKYLERSQLYFRQGNYRFACRYIYLAMLQRLDDTGMIPQQRSRTDREYLALVQQMPQFEAYETLITTHEQLFFGNIEMGAENFEQCRQAYQALEVDR